MKQELLVHYDGILLNYFTGSHFGTGNLHVPVGWKKFYGPFYLYFNEGNDPEELYRDALAKAAGEQEKWPYQWVNDPLYPKVRSNLSGKLLLEDGSPCADTTVILGQGGLAVERQSSGYLYHTRTAPDGSFTLENVRFGTYSLYAYQTGGSNTEQLQMDNIIVSESSQTLPPITWQRHQDLRRLPPRRGTAQL